MFGRGVPGGELAAVLLWGDNTTFKSDLYLCTSKLIWLRSAGLSSMKIRDLRARVSSSKPLLKVGIECSRSCKETQVILIVGVLTHITANC